MPKRREHPPSLVEEYRLVPVRGDENGAGEEKILDLPGLARDLLDHKRILLGSVAIFLALAAFLYLFSERMYYSQTSLIPETQQGSQMGRLLQQYQGLLGVELGSGEESVLNVELYPKIVESLPFQLAVIQSEITVGNEGRRMTIYEYLSEVREPSGLEKTTDGIWSLTFGLPGTVANLFRSGNGGQQREIDFSRYSDFEVPTVLDPQVRSVIREFEEWITVMIEPQTGFLVIGVSMPDARASADAVQVVREQLQHYVTEYRTEKSRLNVEFIEGQYADAKNRFEAAQDTLATFQDRNVNPSTARSMAIEQRLNTNFTLAMNLYTTLANQLEEARIQLQEQTPVFHLHEPVVVPTRPASPNAKILLAGALFLGFVTGVGVLYGRRWTRQFLRDVKQRSSFQEA